MKRTAPAQPIHRHLLRLALTLALTASSLLAGASLSSPVATAQGSRPAVQLVGRAVLPADTFAPGPPSGARINPAEANGRAVPFASQPVQGVSGILPEGGGVYLVLPDNGFGAKGNSDDFLLRAYRVRPAFRTAGGGPGGGVQVLDFIQLRDPDRRIPWPIAQGGTPERHLTGADFDIESVRRAPDGTLWFGDELGPFLLHTDAGGRVLEPPFALPVPAQVRGAARGLASVQSPDHPDFVPLADGEARNAASNLASSRGFEGMALSADGARLYPLLEGALRDDPERRRLLISEFDLRERRYTGRTLAYRLESADHAIGDFTAVNEREYLVIERDNNQGAEARFKKVYLVNLGETDAQGYAPKQELVDLLQIADPSGISRAEGPPAGAIGLGDPFTMPFVTIESVLIQDPSTLLIVNDNNYPFSTGRRPGTPDDTELVLLRLSVRLAVRAGPGPGALGFPRTGAAAPAGAGAGSVPEGYTIASFGLALVILAGMVSYLVERLRRS